MNSQNPFIEKSTVYVLKLGNDCWYVGRTCDMTRRLKEHTTKTGKVRWVKAHGFIDHVFSMDGGKAEENEVTLDLMKIYGVAKVRGGGWVDMNTAVVRPLAKHTSKHVHTSFN